MDNKTTATIYYLAMALFYVKAVLNLTGFGLISGIVWMCLGTVCLCLGIAAKNKDDEDHSSKK